MSRYIMTIAFAAALGAQTSACSRRQPGAAEAASGSAPAAEVSDPTPTKTPALAGPLPRGSVLPMDDVKMKTVDGGSVTLAEIAGKKATLVVFTCNHCPYAKAWEQRVADIGNAYLERGVGVIAINPNDPLAFPEDGFEPMQTRAKKLGLRFPYAVDATSDVARAYGAKKTPEVYLFDADRKLVYHGAVDDSADDPEAVEDAYLKDAIEAVLAGRPVPKAETRAVGCSIKFRPTT